jgi:hypothetical protein
MVHKPKTLIKKAYENVDTLVNYCGYDHSRAIDETVENYDLNEYQENELFRTWLENNSNGIL